jgi:hypothetical protein
MHGLEAKTVLQDLLWLLWAVKFQTQISCNLC